MMTKKNLAKAVTLSVLLMLPYGMAQAKEYVGPVKGAYDTYNEVKTHYNENANTVEAFVYDFSNDKNTKITNKNSFYPYVINPIRSTVIIKDNELIELNGSEYGIYTENINNAGNVILGYKGDDNIIINKKYLESENLKKDIINNLGDVKINISGAGNGQIVGINNTASESVIASGRTEIYAEGGNTVSGVNNQGSNNAAILLKSANITSIASAENGLNVAYGVSAYDDTSIEMLGEAVITTQSIGESMVNAYGIYAKGKTEYTPAEGKKEYTPAVDIDKVIIQTMIDGKNENIMAENIGIKSDNAMINIENGAEIDVISINNSAWEKYNDVYGIWSTNGGNININGTTTIKTSGGQDIAVVAGTENWTDVTATPDDGTNNINLNYGLGSKITGDIISGYGGNIVIGTTESTEEGISTLSARNNNGTLTLTGDALSANGGKLSINLTSGSTWTGRADDYQDADLKEQVESGFFNPKFSHEIAASGTVKVNLAEGAKWDVTGQSWLTKLEGTGGVIDMRNGGADDTSHAVHIGDLEGSHTFVMDLDTEHSVSDMLFIKGNAGGEQKLWINSINGLENLKDGDSLRFATVNSAGLTFSGDYNFGSYENAKNGIMLADNGVMNNAFVIKSEKYDVNDSKKENEGYNGGTEFDEVKPGDEYVDKNYADATNWLLAKDSSGDKVSDAGKTIINMSKVNYNNAIYMDRLNKRLGEARYISPEDEQGMWVRIRHDRIVKDDAFRSQNTMYEMGYDVKQDCDNGERRVGMAIDYMDGKAEYTGIAGDGDVKRYGLWLYDTWLGDKGHYTDYVLKWGHLENDFDIMARTTGEKITGDYSNNVFSASAEYGKKNDMGGGWYFEPQAQLQFARVTGADYVTSQDTKVSLDGINSLIGRAGFRLGRDLNENSTVYIKADLLHEFLGDQDITATDITGTLREEYENEGTWYDVGFGFATALGNNSYAFMDFEKSFGNDNDETYQINAGVQWTF